ncbi:MAG: GNAT family N-acetyltransferase [Crocinitomicaceae bacterium]
MSEREIIHDTQNRQFILPLDDGLKAHVSYSLEGKTMRLTYSEVPPVLRGQGVGKELVEKTFEKLTEEGYEAVAICGYIRVTAQRSPKWSEIIQ